jgi:hypothetical protein
LTHPDQWTARRECPVPPARHNPLILVLIATRLIRRNLDVLGLHTKERKVVPTDKHAYVMLLGSQDVYTIQKVCLADPERVAIITTNTMLAVAIPNLGRVRIKFPHNLVQL